MMRILFLPLFQMSSGHHKVADVLMDFLQKEFPSVLCKKIDFLSYCNEYMEKIISEMYLRWIHFHPSSYHYVYKSLMYPGVRQLEFVPSEIWLPYFEYKMKKMVEKERPDLIVCTHSFPSRILQRLKERRVVQTPVINVYTDFFINGIWGRQGIDYHFVPHIEAKQELVNKYSIEEKRIVVTGIPVHETFMSRGKIKRKNEPFHLLLAGGNQGLGNMVEFFRKMESSYSLRYSVLCGTNEKLYAEIAGWKYPNIRPLSYIFDVEEMNKIYNEVDAIITKPGGVTVSEALHKRLPIFTMGYLPGQEVINLRYLEKEGLIYNLVNIDHYEQKITHVLNNEQEQKRFSKQVDKYFSQIEKTAQNALKDVVMAYRETQRALFQ